MHLRAISFECFQCVQYVLFVCDHYDIRVSKICADAVNAKLTATCANARYTMHTSQYSPPRLGKYWEKGHYSPHEAWVLPNSLTGEVSIAYI